SLEGLIEVELPVGHGHGHLEGHAHGVQVVRALLHLRVDGLLPARPTDPTARRLAAVDPDTAAHPSSPGALGGAHAPHEWPRSRMNTAESGQAAMTDRSRSQRAFTRGGVP